MKKVFFIGFNETLFRHFAIVCAKYELEAVFPTSREDVIVKNNGPFKDLLSEMRAIFSSDIKRVDSAEYVIANLNIFNGICTNDTSFTVGYAFAKHKRVVGHAGATLFDLGESFMDQTPCSAEEKQAYQPASRMVAGATSVIIKGSIEACLEALFEEPTKKE